MQNYKIINPSKKFFKHGFSKVLKETPDLIDFIPKDLTGNVLFVDTTGNIFDDLGKLI